MTDKRTLRRNIDGVDITIRLTGETTDEQIEQAEALMAEIEEAVSEYQDGQYMMNPEDSRLFQKIQDFVNEELKSYRGQDES